MSFNANVHTKYSGCTIHGVVGKVHIQLNWIGFESDRKIPHNLNDFELIWLDEACKRFPGHSEEMKGSEGIRASPENLVIS